MNKVFVCNDERNCYAPEVSLLIERVTGKNGFGQIFSNEDANVKYIDVKFNGTVDSRTMTMFTGDLEIKMRGHGDTTFVSKSRYEAQKGKYDDAKVVAFSHDKNIIEAANLFLDDAQSIEGNKYDPVYSLLSAHHIEELYGNYGSHGRKEPDIPFMQNLSERLFDCTTDQDQFMKSVSKCDAVCVMKLEGDNHDIASTICTKQPLSELANGELASMFNHVIFITRQEGSNAPLVEFYNKNLGRVFSGYIDNQYALTHAALLVGIRHDW